MKGVVVFALEWEYFVCYVILKGSLYLLFWFKKGFVFVDVQVGSKRKFSNVVVAVISNLGK